jgi:hypothetical protein
MTPRNHRWPALAGMSTAVLLLAAFAVSSSAPSASAGGASVVRFYAAHGSTARTSDILWTVGLAAFVLFVGFLRETLRSVEASEGAATVALAGAAILAAGGSTYFGFDYALAVMPSSIDPAAAQAVNLLALSLILPAAGGLLVFGISMAVALVRSAVLPVWTGWAALVIALMAPAGPFALVALALWCAVTGVLVWRRLEHAPAGAVRTAAS